MTPGSSVTFSKLKELILEHLQDTVGEVEDFEVTFAKLEKNRWRANVEFVQKGGDEERPETALFSVDAETGDVTEFQKGYTWRD
jgi:hypothetical protein